MSKLTISTTQLKALINRASQGVGANKLFDLTNYIGIKANTQGLSLYTTDGVNTLWVSAEVGCEDEIDVTVLAETFIKLVNKITSDTVTIEADDKSLTISGNGSYKLDLKLDDEGNLLSFPTKDFNVEVEGVGTVSQSEVQIIQSSLKSSLSDNAGSVYKDYYVGEFICATDKAMLGLYGCKLFDSEDTKFLLSPQFIDLLAYAGEDVSLAYNKDSKVLIANASNFTVVTKDVTDCSEYNIEGLKKMLSIEQESYCKIRKKELLDLLDRLSLFVGEYDDGGITLQFTSNSLKVSSMSSSGVEIVNYAESKDAKDKTVKINIIRLISQLKSYISDMVELYYGSDLCIKLVDGDVTQVIALMR